MNYVNEYLADDVCICICFIKIRHDDNSGDQEIRRWYSSIDKIDSFYCSEVLYLTCFCSVHRLNAKRCHRPFLRSALLLFVLDGMHDHCLF